MPPTATYRLQLRREFGFRDAAAIVPYLASLGVSHVYCSPVLQAAPGSAHGYDVVDHSRLSTDLGGEAGWRALVEACRTEGLGLVVDIVPNHMAVPTPEPLNAAFWDVLRLGAGSAYAEWFDIDWDAQEGRVLMPVLGRSLDDCLAAGEITVDEGERMVRYYDHALPLAPGTEKLADDLPDLLAAQHYRLADWRIAATELNYRRFFDVTSLIGVRVERPEVFDATHELVLRLVSDDGVDGLRIDHPEGLADPAGYLDRLAAGSGGAWTVVEKILEHDELLPRDWRCAGTTGYDAIAAVTRVLTDPAGELPLTQVYAECAGVEQDYATVMTDAKRQVVANLFAAEVNRLLRDLDAIPCDAAAGRPPKDALRDGIVELLVSFDVYRSYPGNPESRRVLDRAVQRAASSRRDLGDAITWLAGVLRGDTGGDAGRRFAVRFEQSTGPVMAKGVEDTTFYRYHRLTALNEVGGDPATFGGSVAEWHEHCTRLARDWPATMTTLSTHDTKRSEDVRARLLVLAEVPGAWATAVRRWREAAARHDPPDANTDYLFWQTLVGAWPIDADRLKGYLHKATREAKRETSWLDPDAGYERRLAAYVDAVLADEALVDDVTGWLTGTLALAGQINALSQKLLQLTMPGVPDVYQGQELDDYSLVDPDNRRPVDYTELRRTLAAVDAAAGAVPAKMLVTATALRLRRDRPGSFAGGYRPLAVTGAAADHAVAFARSDDVATVATRLPVGLARRGGWGDTTLLLPHGEWTDLLTGRPATPRLTDLLDGLPVALLARATG